MLVYDIAVVVLLLDWFWIIVFHFFLSIIRLYVLNGKIKLKMHLSYFSQLIRLSDILKV